MFKFTTVVLVLLAFSNLSLSQILFEDEASLRGVSVVTNADGNGLGISFADYNNDGLDDLTVPNGNGEALKFYKNIGGFFVGEDLLRPEITYSTRSVSWVDYDNDGDKDLFVASDSNGNRLYRRESDASFIDVTTSAGLFTDNVFTYSVSWGDIDNDGCLDLFFSNRTTNTSISNYLFKNNCNGGFTNITQNAGISSDSRLTFGAAFFDYNNDGFQDIYLINDKTSANRMYKNNGNSTFTDVSQDTNTGIIVDAMSVTIDDYDADGFLDIYITNTPSNVETPTLGSILLRNVNGVSFDDVSSETGTQLDGWCWGANFLDAENDADLDLYVSCIYVLDPHPASYGFYENQSNNTYLEPNNIGFLNNNVESFGSAIGDVNNDGKVDIVAINNGNILPHVWLNKTTTTNNYLGVSLEGVVSNKDAVGSKIEISINGNKQYRYILNGEGYLSQHSFKEIFGVGTHTSIDYVKVYWLSGTVDTLLNVSANQTINIVEGSTLNIPDYENDKAVTYYPNPTNNSVTLNASKKIKSISAYNLLGQRVNEVKSDALSVEVDVSNWDMGIYFMDIWFDDTKQRIKIIKQ